MIVTGELRSFCLLVKCGVMPFVSVGGVLRYALFVRLHRHGCRVSDQYFHPHKHTDVSSPIHLWNRDIIEKHLPTIEYRDVMGSDEGLFRWLSGLYGYGVALIKSKRCLSGF